MVPAIDNDNKQRAKDLTRGELEIMQILWDKQNAFVGDILEAMPEPKPAYNTVSTIIRILETKGFVGHEAFGRTHQYHPLVQREEYAGQFMSGVLGSFFGGSMVQMVSFLGRSGNLSVKDFDSIIGVLEEIKMEDRLKRFSKS
jgi:predicted transcriptional regulator